MPAPDASLAGSRLACRQLAQLTCCACCPGTYLLPAGVCLNNRWQRFNAAEAAWFLVGTSYDITTHAAIAGLLAHQLLAVPAAVY